MPADPTQPVPGPTREQVMAAVLEVFKWEPADAGSRITRITDAVMALLPARPSPTDDDRQCKASISGSCKHAYDGVPWNEAWALCADGCDLDPDDDDQFVELRRQYEQAAATRRTSRAGTRNSPEWELMKSKAIAALPGLLAEIERLRAHQGTA